MRSVLENYLTKSPTGNTSFVTVLVYVIRRTGCLKGRLVGEMEGTIVRENKH